MKHTNIQQFNNPQTILAITSYPNPKDGTLGKKEFNAVGWHSQKTLTELATHAPVVVLAEKRDGPTYRRVNDNLLIARTWEKGNVLSFLSLLTTILKLHRIKHIFVQFEFNVFGGIVPNLILLGLMMLLRLMGKTVTFELHQVITNIGLLKKHINISNPLLQIIFNISLKIFYVLLGVIASDIIVFEEELKNRLASYVKKDKINVLSLSVESKKRIAKQKARALTQLPQDEFVLLVFGFINGYKGIDWIINALKEHSGQKMRLVIAGGENPYLKDQPHYQKFYRSIVREAQKYPHVTLTGFVPDTEVTNYFSAADLVVMPYEVFMSASGPFSLALSYAQPIILSDVLTDYAESLDFKQALSKAGLSKKDLFFSLKGKDLQSHIEHAMTDVTYLSRLQKFSKTLAQLRSSDVVVSKLFSTITTPSSSPFALEEPSLSLS